MRARIDCIAIRKLAFVLSAVKETRVPISWRTVFLEHSIRLNFIIL